MKKIDPGPALSATPDGVVLQIKVVPGSSRTRIAGMLGDRLKVMVAAPPEGGKANRAVCGLLSELLRIAPSGVVVETGHGQARKKILLLGASLCAVTERLQNAGDA
jgi:uncharacterized protein (TIGR00251 family)